MVKVSKHTSWVFAETGNRFVLLGIAVLIKLSATVFIDWITAFQLRSEVFRKPEEEALKNYLQTSL